jgi:hypothetical protein
MCVADGRSARAARIPGKASGPRFSGAARDPKGSGRRRCLRVDTLAQRHCVQLGVCRLLLVQVGGQEAHDLVVAEFFGPCNQRPVPAHFVMFDGLGVRDDGGIQHRLVLDLASGLIGFLDDAVDRGTLRPARLLAELFEHLLETFDLLVRLLEVVLEARDEISAMALSIILGSDLRICCSA